MTKGHILVIITIYLSLNVFTLALKSAFNQLTYFEFIQLLPLLRNKRDILGIKTVKFSAFRREFTLHLKRAESILTDNFYVSTLNGVGKIHNYYNIREPESYEGFVAGDHSSSVIAYFDESNSMTAVIETANDTIMIEKLSQYEDHLPLDNKTMIAYRQSDWKNDRSRNKSVCGVTSDSSINYKKTTKENLTRPRRAATAIKKNCELLLVADYKFHKKYGRGDRILTSKYLMEFIGRINRIYRRTSFFTREGTEFLGYGFSIKKILIHEEPSSTDQYKYNDKRDGIDSWTFFDLLMTFSRENYDDFCLAHLFTYQQFSGGVLGYAHIASPIYENPGGICTKGRKLHDDKKYYINTAFTTFKDGVGNSVLTMMAHLSTAHELGHNWGSHHDPDDDRCSPGSQGSGKYIMYSLKVTGYEPNNDLFSPCSKRSIGEVLNSRAFHCFSSGPKFEKFCGNKRTDDGEECDAGSEGDECCSSNCQLHRNATCSKFNSPCCTDDCQLASKNSVCISADEENPCEGEAKCTGHAAICSLPVKLDLVSCAEHGTCLKGRCVPYCEYRGLRSCICDDVKESCLICCMAKNSSNCLSLEKFGQTKLKLNDGRPCRIGVCQEGKCQRTIIKLAERFWIIIKKMHFNVFGEFLKNNLVCTVIILSLIFWIPLCQLVEWCDKQMKRWLKWRILRLRTSSQQTEMITKL